MAFGNGPRLVTTGLDLLVDAADQQSYPGSGTTWRDLRSGVTGSLTGSVSYTSEFYGGLTFSNSSSAVIFPSTTANYGTGSFTVEMAFKPTFINGRHYLMSKNSGSFPNWAIYLSGSAGAGKLWSEFRISSTVSCSVSSSTTFVTGSVYQVDIVLAPGLSGSGTTVNGIPEGGILGNGAGSLTNTGSLFIGNFSLNNIQNFSGSIYTVKTYSTTGFTLPVNNYNATSTRFSKPPIPETAKKAFELLVVAGGGGGGGYSGAGGGAGGLQYFSNYIPQIGTSQIIVGNGGLGGISFNGMGSNGQNSSISTVVSTGGGGGSGQELVAGRTGGSAGGGSGYGGGPGGTGSAGQGNNGGAGSNSVGGGGGGGAGSAGENATSRPGYGGSGSFVSSFAAIGGFPAGWFAGGGGGVKDSNTNPALGGIGGGGNARESGSTNTGGGAGANVFADPANRGGSGIVAIRYLGTPLGIGGEITQSAGFTYHVYRTVGTSSFTIF
jgi:hypothetical protein